MNWCKVYRDLGIWDEWDIEHKIAALEKRKACILDKREVLNDHIREQQLTEKGTI